MTYARIQRTASPVPENHQYKVQSNMLLDNITHG